MDGLLFLGASGSGAADGFALAIEPAALELVVEVVGEDASAEVAAVDCLLLLVLDGVGDDLQDAGADGSVAIETELELAEALFDVLEGGAAFEGDGEGGAGLGAGADGLVPVDGLVQGVVDGVKLLVIPGFGLADAELALRRVAWLVWGEGLFLAGGE